MSFIVVAFCDGCFLEFASPTFLKNQDFSVGNAGCIACFLSVLAKITSNKTIQVKLKRENDNLLENLKS